MASRKRKSTAGEEEILVFAKKSKPTPVAENYSEKAEIQLKLKVQDVIKSALGNPILVDSHHH